MRPILAVVYLIFNQGWGGSRVDLAAEAIHLGRALDLAQTEPEQRLLAARLAETTPSVRPRTKCTKKPMRSDD